MYLILRIGLVQYTIKYTGLKNAGDEQHSTSVHMFIGGGNGSKYSSFKKQKCPPYPPHTSFILQSQRCSCLHILRPFPRMFSLHLVSVTYVIIALTWQQQNCILYPLQSPPSFVSDEPHLELSPPQTRRPFLNL